MRKRLFSTLFAIESLCLAFAAAASPVNVVENGQSPYVIFCEADAPKSVQRAAWEIQRVIHQASGVELPIVHESRDDMIALGESTAARGAGINPSRLLEEEFVISPRNHAIFVAGRDTRDGELSWGASNGSGASTGTLWAAYEFLERLTGARWLMPGEVGEEIPKADKLTWRGGEVRSGPAFPCRVLAYVQETAAGRKGFPDVEEGLVRMRTGGTFNIVTNHAWRDYVQQDTLGKHPEFLAANGDRDKYNTSNRALVDAFAQGVIKAIAKNPHSRFYSISPEDGGGFSKDPETMKLVENDPHGDPSYSAVILKFYNDVARIVAKKYPDKILAGYVYYNYMYPPKEPLALEPNLHLRWAALEYYGFGLYKPKYEGEFEATAQKWCAMAKGKFSYTSYSHFMRNRYGAPVPPGFGILKIELPILHRIGANGAFMVGNSAWGSGALLNYLLARQLWNPELDIHQETREWLKLAYGPGWPSMEKLYHLLDDAYRKQKEREIGKRNYEVTFDVVKGVYLPILSQLEPLYLEALRAAQTGKQKARLELFADNMREFHHLLKKAGLIDPGTHSYFDLSDAEYDAFWHRASQTCYVGPISKPIWIHEQREIAVHAVPERVRPPQIDGSDDDPAWQSAAAAGQFRLTGSQQPGEYKTKAKLLFDDKALYALMVSEIPADSKAGDLLPKDDARIYHGSNVGLYLHLENEAEKWWHFTVNPANSRWDGLNDHPESNLEWQSASKIAGKKWVVELRIPFAALGQGKAPFGQKWRGNFVRQQTLTGRSPFNENTAWNSVEEHFAQPSQFGDWVFDNKTNNTPIQ